MSIISKYDRISLIYDMMEAPVERFLFRKWRRAILSDLSGNVLEVGVGTGKNLEYYPRDCKVTAIDISPKMLHRAEKRAEGMDNISLMVMDAENLTFADNSFDYVITTFVLCSIPNPVAALREMRRVCKPDGITFLKNDGTGACMIQVNGKNPAGLLDYVLQDGDRVEVVFGFCGG